MVNKMKIRFLIAAISAAFLLSGCTIVAQDLVQAKELAKSETIERVDQLKAWYQSERSILNSYTSALVAQGQAKIATGEIDQGLNLMERALEIHRRGKPEFLFQKLLDRKKADEDG